VKVHIHNWVQNGKWKCTNEGHCHSEPDTLDAATVWHVLGVIRTHNQTDNLGICECGWTGTDYMEHLDDAVFYWLREYNPSI
jgi:hypothetical protein